ncbi:MAG: hypothetical protein V3Q69_02675 [Burkholderia sp.]
MHLKKRSSAIYVVSKNQHNKSLSIPCTNWHCCINRARSTDVYAPRSRGQLPIKSDSRVTA